MDEAGFLAAIREDPENEAPRLIYADWLDENGRGDEAEFLRAAERVRSSLSDVVRLYATIKPMWLMRAVGGYEVHILWATPNAEHPFDAGEVAGLMRRVELFCGMKSWPDVDETTEMTVIRFVRSKMLNGHVEQFVLRDSLSWHSDRHSDRTRPPRDSVTSRLMAFDEAHDLFMLIDSYGYACEIHATVLD